MRDSASDCPRASERNPRKGSSSIKTRDLVDAAFFAGSTVILGLIIIPVYPVPVTGQSMGPMLAGSILGGRLGALSLVVFDLLAAAGVPVLSGMRGGIGILLGPTGGYILSWPVAALVIGKLLESQENRTFSRYLIANTIGGVIVVYLIGASWLGFMQGLDLKTALIEGALIFLLGDVIKVFAASWIAMAVNRVYPRKDHR